MAYMYMCEQVNNNGFYAAKNKLIKLELTIKPRKQIHKKM